MTTSPFSITPTPPTSIKLAAGQEGKLSFTVTSLAAPGKVHEVILQALLVPEDGKGKEVDWLVVGPRPSLSMAGGETQTVTITARPTAASPRGEHDIKLVVADKDQPHEEYTYSPPVACEVLALPVETSPPGKPRPWWLIPAIVGGLLLVAGGAWIVWKVTTGPGPTPSHDAPVPPDAKAWLQPSNGLGPLLDAAAAQQAITLPSGTTINTDTGEVRSSAGAVAVATVTVAQQGGPSLRVFLARTWTIHDVRVDGSLPIAFVSIGDLKVVGTIDVSANGGTAGPGAASCGTSGDGRNQHGGFWQRAPAGYDGSFLWAADGAGGGGFGTAGGDGGNDPLETLTHGAGGVVNGSPALTPLRGGCSGGGASNRNAANGYGGGGGGAIQLVSGAGEIRITGAAPARAGIHAGGGGGRGADKGTNDPNNSTTAQSGSGGGGSGGGILLEAASVVFEGSAQLLAAGGGGGGAGACGDPRHGQDAPPSAATPGGGLCPPDTLGQPASGGAGASAGAAAPGVSTGRHAAGSGGGARGRIRINTATGAYTGDVLIRGESSTGTVQTQ